MAGGPWAQAGTRAGLGSLGARVGAAVAAPGRRGPCLRSSPETAASSAPAPRERGARQDPGAAPRGARGIQKAAPACVTTVGLLTAAPPTTPVVPWFPPSPRLPAQSQRLCQVISCFPWALFPHTRVSPLLEPGAGPLTSGSSALPSAPTGGR